MHQAEWGGIQLRNLPSSIGADLASSIGASLSGQQIVAIVVSVLDFVEETLAVDRQTRVLRRGRNDDDDRELIVDDGATIRAA